MLSSLRTPRALRRLTIVLAAFAGAWLAGALSGRVGGSEAAVAAAAALATCAIYAWLLDSLAWSLALSAVALLGLLWVWGVQRGAMGWPVAAFALLAALAAKERLRRSRLTLRLRRSLEDLREAQAERERAIAAAEQARDGLERKLGRYEQLQSLVERLSALAEFGAISQLAVEEAFALIGKSDACSLFMLEADRQELSLAASRKRDPSLSLRAKHGDQFDRHVLRTHKPLLVNDVRRDYRFTASVGADRPVASVIAAPLLLGERPEGVLRLDSTMPSAYTQDDLRLLDILTDLVATAVANAKLFLQVQQLAVTDSLTGLWLRRPWLEQLTLELARAARAGEPSAVLMLDVDHFKRYNDTYGHIAGDAVLRNMAGLLRQALPAGGSAARYGGEEFAVLLPQASRHDAATVAERLRALVERETEPARSGRPREKQRPRVTVSIGVAVFPEDAQAELELIRTADQRLYQAKHAGRNQVCAA